MCGRVEKGGAWDEVAKPSFLHPSPHLQARPAKPIVEAEHIFGRSEGSLWFSSLFRIVS